MPKKTLPRHRLAGAGWMHPYSTGPFSPFLYADGGGDGGGSGSGSDGGGADGGGQDGGDGGGDGGGSGNGGDGTRSGAGKDGGQGKDGDGGGEDLAATVKQLKKELADARRDAGKARTDAKKQAADDAVAALTQQLGKALGFVKDDTPPDPAKLAEAIAQKDTTIAERESTLRAKDVELAVWSRADKAGAKAAALLDSRAFLSKLAELDPADKQQFTSALDDAIKAAVKDNPGSFAAQAPAGRSGADLSGGSGEGKTKRTGSLAGAIANHYQT
ncbi:hypothetical protein [Streptomyces sp. Z26]|uniref:hypothetical protein n=1 Tax=Streptomyces sp. Z26 TaxID=2500177 RepID=UPI000EF15EE9|nr:hypothetical protein [Streptomyces sp. Z26]RLL66986.1 hypothetical protein D7M15_09035 [Streptomyces sp. Z26]